jgi:hypothetical protein
MCPKGSSLICAKRKQASPQEKKKSSLVLPRTGNKEGRRGREMALEHHGLTERIMGAAIDVRRRLDTGFLESV